MLSGSSELRNRHHNRLSEGNHIRNNDYTNNTSDMFSSTSNGSAHSSRDRTNEFANAVRAMQTRVNPITPTSVVSNNNNINDFMQIARSIGRDIANTYEKLEKLTLLARRRTIFDDKPMEIQELTFIIKEDMSQLNRQIGQLQQISRHKTSSKSHQVNQHSGNVVVALQSRLAGMTNNFQRVLEVRSENLRESKTRQAQFESSASVTTTLPASAMQGFHSGSLLAAMEQDEQQNDSVAINMNNTADHKLLQDGSLEYLQSRADNMKNIESTIVELGSIFSQLAHMVSEQEEVMLRIDNNVDDASMNVDSAHTEILKYFQSVTSNRSLMIKVFGVLIFFFILFIIFMA